MSEQGFNGTKVNAAAVTAAKGRNAPTIKKPHAASRHNFLDGRDKETNSALVLLSAKIARHSSIPQKEILGGDSIAFNFIALIIAPDSSKY